MLPSFHTVLDLGLRDVGVRNDRRRLAAHFGPRTALLAALAVVFAIVPCWVLRQLGADAWVVGAFALAWAGTVLAVVLRTALRAPVAIVKVTADGPNQASWLLIAPFSLVAVLALLSRDVLLLPLVALHAALAVVLWRGRRRLPDLLARFRSVLAWDETVLGDGLGIAEGLRGRGSARVVVATDRRLLVAGDTERLLELDVPYAGVSRFGMEWKARGRLGVLSLLVDGEMHVVTSIAPANLLSIAQALQGHGVATDDPAAVAAAQRGWEEALRRAPRPGRGHARAAMRSRAFDQGLWLLLGLCAVIFYLNPFGIGLGAARDGVPALMAVPAVCAVCGYVARTRSSLAYLVPLNLLVTPAFFFTDAGDVLGVMLATSALATVGLSAGSALGEAMRGAAAGESRGGALRAALGGPSLIRISGGLLAAMVALVGASAAAGFELPDLRLAVEQATAKQLPVDGRSDLTGGAASLSYTPGPGLHELVTDEEPLAGPYDGARWELRSSPAKGYNVITLGHYIVQPRLTGAAAIARFIAEKDAAHSRLAGRPVTHTRRVVDGRTGYVWDHGGPRGYWYYAAWFPEPVHSVRVECIARRQADRFKRLCAEAMGSLSFR